MGGFLPVRFREEFRTLASVRNSSRERTARFRAKVPRSAVVAGGRQASFVFDALGLGIGHVSKHSAVALERLVHPLLQPLPRNSGHNGEARVERNFIPNRSSGKLTAERWDQDTKTMLVLRIAHLNA